MKKKQSRSRRPITRKASRARRTPMVKVKYDETGEQNYRFFVAITTANPKQAGVLQSSDFKRKFQEWRAHPASASVAFVMMLGMVRPEPFFHEDANRRFLAYDSSFYPDTAFEDRANYQKLWERMINVPAASMDFIKSGPEIWKTLGIGGLEEQTKRLLRLKCVDPATCEAVHAALWSAFNTSSIPFDIDTALFVLATFIHGHPAFKDFVGGDVFSKPYGEATVYGILKRSELDANDNDPSHDHPSDGSIDDDDVAGACLVREKQEDGGSDTGSGQD
jgi:hypothetical protein